MRLNVTKDQRNSMKVVCRWTTTRKIFCVVVVTYSVLNLGLLFIYGQNKISAEYLQITPQTSNILSRAAFVQESTSTSQHQPAPASTLVYLESLRIQEDNHDDSSNGEPIFQTINDPSQTHLNDNYTSGKEINALCPQGYGIEGKGGNEVLQKVKGGINKYNKRVPGEHRRSKILCMVYTVDLPTSRSNLKAIYETWGAKCDGFIAASNITDHATGSIKIFQKGLEEYGNMWQKIRSMWAMAYDNYLDEFDFFHISGDDVYIAVENLRAFLDGPDVYRLENGYLDEISRDRKFITKAKTWLNGSNVVSGRPLYFGMPCRFKSIFPCGGPGYTLNRAALEVFGRMGLHSWRVNYTDSREDLFMGNFFSSVGIQISHVFDHPNGMRYGESAAHCNRNRDDLKGPGQIQVAKRYGLLPDRGFLDGISEKMATFHLKLDIKSLIMRGSSVSELIRRYHAILYDLC